MNQKDDKAAKNEEEDGNDKDHGNDKGQGDQIKAKNDGKEKLFSEFVFYSFKLIIGTNRNLSNNPEGN